MELKIIDLGNKSANAAIKVLTEYSDICIISNVANLSEESKKELYNSKWIVNCTTMDDYKETIKLAKELRPKQLFIMDVSKQLDEFSRNEIKSWRGDILSTGSTLELSNKAEEGFFSDNSQWNIEDGGVNSFQLDKRYRVEGREFVLCNNNTAYGHMTIGKVSESGDSFRYEVESFKPLKEKIKLNIPEDIDSIFVDNIWGYVDADTDT